MDPLTPYLPHFYNADVLNLIDRYISKAFLTFFFSGLVVFLTLFLVVDFMTQMIGKEVSGDILIRYYTAFSMEILYQMIPVAVMVGVVFTLSALNKSRELTALFSLGMGLRRILMPMFIWVTLLVGLSFYLGDQVLPSAKQKKNYIKYVEIQKKPGLYSTVKTNKIWYRSDNIIFNIKLLDANAKKAFGVTLYYFSPDWRMQQVISAKVANIQAGAWELLDGSITLFIEDLTTPLVKNFESKFIGMTEELSDLQTASSASDFLSFKELGQYISKNKEAGLDMTNFEVDYHNKLSFPFTIFVMALLGVPFVIAHQRSGGTAKNVSLILVMTFIFWTTYSSGMSLGKYGYIPPILAAWGPNFLILLMTYFIFRYKKV
ncbi:MAG: LPS export ABC transporter permease LptG [Bdellovibrionales bacterium]|nr:LPS export ABC transporter permease LptG [Bdellovibrionales bacterium]